ncbi:putative myo-inositol-1-phosphate synthase [Candidatus Nitrososphaera gargensis Ga9.2]|uniref:Putative myo-inositol-1-phosphate synthase n=1 Tax=Nitrososphaera gargensis (strain Ga9.2) TaxID=1237085 RepID=K0IGW3_NITGG|nr:myo-inositol-1-phosphate synthase [Candidatus Nitrososphaera gargensis]AFU59095.1 putative myo-inositol-1-phosphate synthase [Candidatus Nitrososphaera gargensis Ga9.2]
MAGDIMVAVIGVGNVGATFVQGVDYYSNGKNTIGLWHQKVAGLKPSNVKVVAAFDIDPAKVGKNLSQVAVESTRKYHDIKDLKITISPGILADSSNDKIERPVKTSPDEFAKELKKSGAQVALNLISSGMDKTSLEYAKAALAARVSFVNATPAKIATNPALAKKFASSRLVLAGDDLLSQFGGTAFHKGMIDFMVERGVHIKKSYQLDVGGSAETKNTMDERIRMLKRGMKTGSIGMEAPYKFESVAGTTEYTDFLGDSRNSYYWMSSEGFLGSSIVMDLTLRTSDGANAGNVLLDVVRAATTAKKAKVSKASEVISAYGFKNPPKQFKIREAYANFVSMFSPS